MLRIFLVVIVIFVVFLCVSANFARAFRVKNGVITISDGAFMLAQNLKNVKLPESVTYIGIAAFYGCINICSSPYFLFFGYILLEKSLCFNYYFIPSFTT